MVSFVSLEQIFIIKLKVSLHVVKIKSLFPLQSMVWIPNANYVILVPIVLLQKYEIYVK